MEKLYQDLSPSAQTAYAEILDQVTIGLLRRTVADLNGNFARKTVTGKEYWYFQYRDVDSRVRQIYLGPHSERLDRLIADKEAQQAKKEPIARQAKAAIALGNQGIVRSQYRVIRRLEEYGLFKAGGVLIGTHAFACHANMLGVSWADSNKTHDVDFDYAGKSVALALPSDVKLDVHDAITSLEMGFLPAVKLDGLAGGSYVIPHRPDFRIDFITTVGRNQTDLVNFPNLDVAMVPLKFIEYSLQDIQQAALLSEEGAILVNVPHPARYALHKLIVAGEREHSFKTKSNKDLRQSAALLQFYAEHQPDELMLAWEDLQGRGKGWRSRFDAGVDMLVREMPDITGTLIWPGKEKAQASIKDVQEPDRQAGVYIGKVVEVGKDHVIQHIGRGNHVKHDVASLDRLPEANRECTVQYRAGRGTVTTNAHLSDFSSEKLSGLSQ